MPTPSKNRDETKTSFKRILALGIPAVLCTIAIRVFVFGLYVVPTSSMVPTLLKGDYIFAEKYTYGYSGIGSFNGLINTVGRIGGRPPERGEVIVFKSPAPDGITLIKRLIGLPGDRVQMIQSQLYLNGAMIRRDKLHAPIAFPGDDEETGDYVDYVEYLNDNQPHVLRLIRNLEDEETVNNTEEITVPDHCYFFMGDNRDASDDSRVSDLGCVPEENLIGKAAMTFFSMSQKSHLWQIGSWRWAIRWPRLFAKIK